MLSACFGGAPDTSGSGEAGNFAEQSRGFNPLAGIAENERRFYGQTPVWRSCEAEFPMECARITVPLNWAQPEGETIEISAARQTLRENSQGYIFYNPGGPGVEVINSLANYGSALLPAPVARRYSLVAIDPRGVGESAPVHCLYSRDKDQLFFGRAPAEPNTPEYERYQEEQSSKLREACVRNSGSLLSFVDTASAARDMDVVRAVLSSPTLNYVGFSYGTYLGAIYATLFPSRVRRMVLDSPITRAESELRLVADQIIGFEKSLREFLEGCGNDACGLSGNTVDSRAQQLQRLLNRLNENPLPLVAASYARKYQSLGSKPIVVANGENLVLSGASAALGIISGLYSERQWDRLRTALKYLAEYDIPQPMFQLASLYLQRSSKGSYTNSYDAQSAINCIDRRPGKEKKENHGAESRRESEAEVEEIKREVEEKAPLLGSMAFDSRDSCAGWPHMTPGQVPNIDGSKAPDILVVAATGDNATPYHFAGNMMKQLGKGRLLTRVGAGHTSYRQGNSCIDTVVDNFLNAGDLPAGDVTCATPNSKPVPST